MSPKPHFFFQKIFRKDRTVCGIELLARNFNVNPYTDVHIFYCALEVATRINVPCPVHINIFGSSIRHIDWKWVSKQFGSRIVVEVVEDDIQKHVYDFEYLLSEDIKFALDDFGSGASNFSILKELPFPIVKADADFVSEGTVKLLKEEFGIPCLIVEKADRYPADAYQSFSLHYPEPIEVLKEGLSDEEETQNILQR